MKKYLFDYIEEIDKKIQDKDQDYTKLMEYHLIKLRFFQHERLIHLLVTLFYCLFMILFLALGLIHPIFLIIFFILVVFVILYVIHYFRLENGVQYLYKQYDEIRNRVKE